MLFRNKNILLLKHFSAHTKSLKPTAASRKQYTTKRFVKYVTTRKSTTMTTTTTTESPQSHEELIKPCEYDLSLKFPVLFRGLQGSEEILLNCIFRLSSLISQWSWGNLKFTHLFETSKNSKIHSLFCYLKLLVLCTYGLWLHHTDFYNICL